MVEKKNSDPKRKSASISSHGMGESVVERSAAALGKTDTIYSTLRRKSGVFRLRLPDLFWRDRIK